MSSNSNSNSGSNGGSNNEAREAVMLPDGLIMIEKAGFRELYHHYLYIHCMELLADTVPEVLAENDTGMFVYGYIDEHAGISYRPLALACYDGEKFAYRKIPGALSRCIFRYHDRYIKQEYQGEEGTVIMATVTSQDHGFMDLEETDIDLSVFDDEVKAVRENYDLNKDPKKEELRSEKYSYMDRYRNKACPDDVMVVLYRPDVKPESVWVRCRFEAENEVFGTMLNEPKANFNIHKGAVIGFVPYGEGEEMILVATGHTARTIG